MEQRQPRYCALDVHKMDDGCSGIRRKLIANANVELRSALEG